MRASLRFGRVAYWVACLTVCAFVHTALAVHSMGQTATSDDVSQETAVVKIVNFERDVRPILELRCLQCHGPEDAKNGFRVDDHESILGYLEPADIDSSSLWTDYLHTSDSEMLMPPASSDGKPAGLTGVELATIKLWIEEGADWEWNTLEVKVDPELNVSPTAPLANRIWAFQGLFHPASVHFPVALLMVSSLFVFLSFFKRAVFEPAAFHCLWIGALGAVASCVMGWSYAVHEGYGNTAALSIDSAIDRHRWLGIAVAVVSLILIPIASGARAKKSGGVSKRIIWFLGSVFAAFGVSMVGYQGGELIYGEDHYQQEFQRLFPEAFAEETTPTTETLEVETIDSSKSDSSKSDSDDAKSDDAKIDNDGEQVVADDSSTGAADDSPSREAEDAITTDETTDSEKPVADEPALGPPTPQLPTVDEPAVNESPADKPTEESPGAVPEESPDSPATATSTVTEEESPVGTPKEQPAEQPDPSDSANQPEASDPLPAPVVSTPESPAPDVDSNPLPPVVVNPPQPTGT